jgi:hypothetical protein
MLNFLFVEFSERTVRMHRALVRHILMRQAKNLKYFEIEVVIASSSEAVFD